MNAVQVEQKSYEMPPREGIRACVEVLAQCTRRVAISNGRLLDLVSGQVRLRWRDSKSHRRREQGRVADNPEGISCLQAVQKPRLSLIAVSRTRLWLVSAAGYRDPHRSRV